MIPLPSKPKIVEKKKENTALFEIDSLYPGYGATVGNSLRRVLLSSLGGVAITKMKIEGINHEFSTIPGVMEDVVTIMMNLKEMRFIMHSDGPEEISLSVKGEKKVKGSDLKLPTQVELISPDTHIATLTNKKASLEMSLEIERGTGYSSAEDRKEEKLDVGKALLDAIFTPIRRVNFYVENMRVGERTDFDRLFIEIETDGTMSPENALFEASDILVKHFEIISPPEEENKKAPKKEKKVAKKEEDKEEDLSIEELKISARNANILKENKITSVKDLLERSEDDLSDLKGMGEKGVEEIKKALKKKKYKLSE